MFNTVTEIESFIRQFESGSLPKVQWTHHAHLVAGLWYLQHRTPREVLPLLRERIRRYNEAVGGVNSDTGGYHETITRLFLWGIDRQKSRLEGRCLSDQVADLLQSPLASKDWPLTYYSRDCLFSIPARRGWVEPDVVPLEPPAEFDDENGHSSGGVEKEDVPG